MNNFSTILSLVLAGSKTDAWLASYRMARTLYNKVAWDTEKSPYYESKPVNVRHLHLRAVFEMGFTEITPYNGIITWLRRIHEDHPYYEAGVVFDDGSCTLFVVDYDPVSQAVCPLFCACYGESKNERLYGLFLAYFTIHALTGCNITPREWLWLLSL